MTLRSMSLLSLTPLALALAIFAGPVNAECTAASGAQRNVLLELYTSEGCSSCPPADQWLSRVKSAGISVVPLAFHVDYWNKLGWPDRFSSAEYTARQHEVSRRNALSFVYTPQLVLNGRDFREASGTEMLSRRVTSINATPRATLRITQTASNADELKVDLTAALASANAPNDAQAFLAVVEDKLSSQVNAGENQGKRLNHDAVVRTLLGPFPVAAANNTQIQKSINLDKSWKRNEVSLVAFVQSAKSGETLQALQAPLCQQ